MSTPLGRFAWYDHFSPKPAAALEFYTAVVGWTVQPFPTEKGDYMMLATEKGPMGGVMEMPPSVEAPPHWLPYIGTPDLDATAAAITAHGGQVRMGPTDIFGVGRFLVFRDPQGAHAMAFQPQEHRPAVGMNVPGQVGWHELATSDVDGAVAFYGAVFGWQKGMAMEMGADGTYQMFRHPDDSPGCDLGGIMKMHGGMSVAAWGLYVTVPSVFSAAERIAAAGGKVIMGPHPIPGGGHIVIGIDTQGGVFHLVSPPPAA